MTQYTHAKQKNPQRSQGTADAFIGRFAKGGPLRWHL